MRLQEYQGKELFKRVGIAVPEGQLASTPLEAEKIAKAFGSKVVIKAQVLVGGRGKAGFIQLANTPTEARQHAQKMLGQALKGERVEKLLIAKAVDIQKEFYLGITIDRAKRSPVVIFSTQGGIEIESIAKKTPNAIFRVHANALEGLHAYQIRNLLYQAGIDDKLFKPLHEIVERLYKAFSAYQASLVEINPLALTRDGQLIAVDAKVIIDDEALDTMPELLEYKKDSASESPQEQMARQHDLQYVKLDGDIGIIGNGAGLVMATLDLVQLVGGSPANFLDVGGGANAEKMQKAMEIVLKDSAVKGLFINIFGGITRCDEVARGLIAAKEAIKIKKPMVVRLTGTNEEEGRRILEQNGIVPVRDMEEGAESIVRFVHALRC